MIGLIVWFPSRTQKYMKKGLPEEGQHISVQCGILVVTLWQDTKPFFVDSKSHDQIKLCLS